MGGGFSMTIAGKVAPVPKGDYDISAAYEKLNVVRYNNNAYMAIKPNTGIEPTNEEYWMLLMEDVSQAQFDEIINGTTTVGNALKLNGLGAEEFVSNENLLINADFKNPVNSSGKTEYTNGNQWTIDKWFSNYSTYVSIVNGCVNVRGDNDIKQTFDVPLPSKTYTLSFKARSADSCIISVYAKTEDNTTAGNIGQKTLTTDWKIYTLTFTNSVKTVHIAIAGASRGQNHSFDLEWIKLEVGSVATPFVPPNKEVEKLKCGATVGDADTVGGKHASDFLLREGGTIEGRLDIKRGSTEVMGLTATSGEPVTMGFSGKSGKNGSFGFMNTDNPTFWKADGTTLGHALHTGNFPVEEGTFNITLADGTVVLKGVSYRKYGKLVVIQHRGGAEADVAVGSANKLYGLPFAMADTFNTVIYFTSDTGSLPINMATQQSTRFRFDTTTTFYIYDGDGIQKQQPVILFGMYIAKE